MKKKLGAMLIVALFVIGMIPVAFAEEPAATAGETEFVATDDVDIPDEDEILARPQAKRAGLCIEKLKKARPNIGPARAKAICQKKFGVAQVRKGKAMVEKGKTMVKRGKKAQALAQKKVKRFKELKKFRTKVNKRVVAKERLQKARANFKMAKANYINAKDKLVKARNRVEAAKNLYAACNEDPDSDECKSAKEELMESWREKLINHADLLIEHFLKVKSKVEENDAMTDEEVEKAVAALDKWIEEARVIRAEIKEAQDKESLVKAARALHNLWTKSRVRAGGFVGRVVADRFAGIIQQAKQLEIKLNAVLERAADKGLDTSAAEAKVDEFNEAIANAESSYEEAKALYKKLEEAKESEQLPSDYEEMRKNAHQKIVDAKNYLVTARKILGEIIKLIRDAGASSDLAEVSVEEAEEEAEAEEETTEETEEEEEEEEETTDEASTEEATDESAEVTTDEASTEDTSGSS